MIILGILLKIIVLVSIGSFFFAVYVGFMTEIGRNSWGRPFTTEEMKELKKWDY